MGLRATATRNLLEPPVSAQTIELLVSSGSDITTNLAAAVASGGASSRVALPVGTYYVSSTITIPYDRVHIQGAGMWATSVVYTAATGSCFKLAKTPGAILYQPTIEDLSISATDTVGAKVAIELVDVSSPLISRVAIGPVGGWTGSNSEGIRIKGRECGIVQFCSLAADIPVRAMENPNVGASIDLDFDVWEFRSNLYYASATNACVQVDNGAYLTTLKFTGSGDFIAGKYGILWNDTTTTGNSYGLSVQGHRAENLSAGGWMIYVSTNAVLRLVTLIDLQTGSGATWNGYYLRGCQQVTMMNVAFYGNGGATALDINETCTEVAVLNCFWQQGSTVNLGALEEIFSPGNASITTPGRTTAWYQPASIAGLATVVRMSGTNEWRQSRTIANGLTIYSLPKFTNPGIGRLQITVTNGASVERGTFDFIKAGTMIGSNLSANMVLGVPAAGKFGVVMPNPAQIQLMNNLAANAEYALSLSWVE